MYYLLMEGAWPLALFIPPGAVEALTWAARADALRWLPCRFLRRAALALGSSMPSLPEDHERAIFVALATSWEQLRGRTLPQLVDGPFHLVFPPLPERVFDSRRAHRT